MLERVRTKLSYANVMATIAVFVALGGAAYAVTLAPKNSVNSRAIINGQVKAVDLHRPEAFHVVGTPGEPPFMNGASSFGVFDRSPVAFYRDPLGVVHLRGAIDQGTGNNGKAAFKLPAGYRPPKSNDSVVPTAFNSPQPTGRVVTLSNGKVYSASAPGGATVLDGITFRCAPSGSNGCP